MAETVQSVDPRTGQAGPTYAASTPSDVRAAVTASAQAACSPAWRDDERRAAFLRGAGARLREADGEIVALVQSETGLPEGRAVGELERTCRQLEAFADVVEAGDYVDAMIDTADPDAQPIPRPSGRPVSDWTSATISPSASRRRAAAPRRKAARRSSSRHAGEPTACADAVTAARTSDGVEAGYVGPACPVRGSTDWTVSAIGATVAGLFSRPICA